MNDDIISEAVRAAARPQRPRELGGHTSDTLQVGRGKADDLGKIVKAEFTLAAIADLFTQALAVPVTYTHAELCEARDELKSTKALRDAAVKAKADESVITSAKAAVKTAESRIDRMKRTPWITFASFRGSRRIREDLITATAFVGDADRGAKLQPLLDQLNELGCSYIVHTSTSHGCERQERYRVIIPLATPLTNPRKEYAPLWQFMNGLLGNVLDPGAKDPTRLSYMPRQPQGATGHTVVCVDDRPWFDASSIPGVIAIADTPPYASTEAQTSITPDQEADLRSALAHPAMLEWLGTNKNWSDCGYWLLSLGAKGRELFLWVSALAPGFEADAPQHWWSAHADYKPESDFRSVFKKSATLGWKNPHRVTVSDPSVFPMVPSTDEPAPLQLQLAGNGTPRSNVHNAALVLARQTRVMLTFDEFKQGVFVRWPEDPKPHLLTDEDVTRVQIEMQKMGMTQMSSTAVYDALRLVAKQNITNCVTDYLNGLKWDGTRRLSMLMPRGFGTTVDRYHTRAGRNMLIAMVARALNPGCKVDEAVILEGNQGTFKSSALQIIGGDHFKELTAHPSSKDFEQQLLGVWLGEFAELNALRRTEDIARIKQFMTCTTDWFRPPYGKVMQEFKRRTVLCGSTNEECWLHDPTGGRRFIPVEVGHVDLDWLRENRDQLFAEAVTLFNAGRKWWVYPKAETLARQEARTPEDPWLVKIREYLCGRKEVTDVSEVLDRVLEIPADRQNKTHTTRVGQLLKKLGCVQQSRRRVSGILKRPWVVPAEFASQPIMRAEPVAFQPIAEAPVRGAEGLA